MHDGRPKPVTEQAVGVKEVWECSCVFLKFDIRVGNLMDRLYKRYGNFVLMCGGCGKSVAGQVRHIVGEAVVRSEPTKQIIWVHDSRSWEGAFYEVKKDG